MYLRWQLASEHGAAIAAGAPPSRELSINRAAYMKEPGDQELVVSRGPDGEDVAMPEASADDTHSNNLNPPSRACSPMPHLPTDSPLLQDDNTVLHHSISINDYPLGIPAPTPAPPRGFFASIFSSPPPPIPSTSTSTSPLALAHTRTNSFSLTTAPYTRGHRPSASSSTLFSLARKKSSASLRSPYDGTPGGSSISLADQVLRPPAPEQLKAISGTREGGVRRFGVPFGEAAETYAASANASRVDLGKDLPPGSPSRRLLRRSAAPSMRRADDALATPDPYDVLSTLASHGVLASPDPRDAPSTPHSRRPDVQSHFPRLAAGIHAGEWPSFLFFSPSRLAPTPLARSESAPCAYMLRSAAADSERCLAAEAYALAESQYGSISRAPAREPRMCSVHTSPQHVKARKGVPESVTQGAPGARAHVCKAALGKNASPRRLEHPRRVFGLRSRPRIDSHWRGVPSPLAGSRGTPPGPASRAESADSAHVRLAARLTRARRGAASLWLAHRRAACGRDACTQLVPSRVARAAVCTRARRVAPSPLARIGLALLVGNARAVSII
ncbi:hypothetical protein C8J57DRAFT_1598088 [Mycena rebaudengoi]|nr:hypothetical protein C8J57DRAFT_1598088 [Mycena rebaudengoi]